MKRSSLLFAALAVVVSLASCVGVLGQTTAPAPTAAPADKASGTAAGVAPALATSIERRVEKYLRTLYAWGPDYEVQAGPINASPTPGLYEVPVKVGQGSQSDTGLVYVSKDGRYMFRGDLQDLNTDPTEDARKKIHLDGYASKGPADAKVTVVEFADFECPSCRQLEYILRVVLPKYPQVHFVFKDYPLGTIHPWASIAAVAGRCALAQSNDNFWKLHDSIYDNQDAITPENASAKLTEYASAAGVDSASFQTCMTNPKTGEAIQKSVDEGHSLAITGTPTLFVDGRRIVGPDQNSLDQFIRYDLDNQTAQKANSR